MRRLTLLLCVALFAVTLVPAAAYAHHKSSAPVEHHHHGYRHHGVHPHRH